MKKWFDLNLGWIFINGRKQEHWAAYLEQEYGTTHGSQEVPRFFQLVVCSALRAIGIPIILVAVIIASPAIFLLVMADSLESSGLSSTSEE